MTLATQKLDSADAEPRPHTGRETIGWLVAVGLLSGFYFLLYFSPMSLHDAAHYAISGVSMVRDHKNLIYPYNPLAPGGLGPAYDYFQNGTITFGTRTNYPAKLYSLLYGAIYLITGRIRFEYLHILSFIAFLIGNVFLYLIGRKYLRGIELAIFMISVAFLPLMFRVITPGTDGIGYASALFIFWLVLSKKSDLVVVGLAVGILAHTRSQLISIVVILPFLATAVNSKLTFLRPFLKLLVGAAFAYFATSLILNLFIETASSGNPVEFYVTHFRGSFYGLAEMSIFFNKLVRSFVSLFAPTHLFIFGFTTLLCLAGHGDRLIRNLAIAGSVYVALPVITYSLDRFADPQPRYFLAAIPLLSLATLLLIKQSVAFGLVRRSTPAASLLAVLVLMAWYSSHGFPIQKLSPKFIESRLQYLDFPGAQRALAREFRASDIIIINHSLPTGLFPMNNVLMIPAFSSFFRGDNSRIDGLVFVIADTPPNDFFTPKEWMKGSALPPVISDAKGVSFRRAFESTSTMVEPDGSRSQPAYFYIYKRT